MMKVLICCPHCGVRMSVEESYLGRTARCPKCQKQFTVTVAKSDAAKSDTVKSTPQTTTPKPTNAQQPTNTPAEKPYDPFAYSDLGSNDPFGGSFGDLGEIQNIIKQQDAAASAASSGLGDENGLFGQVSQNAQNAQFSRAGSYGGSSSRFSGSPKNSGSASRGGRRNRHGFTREETLERRNKFFLPCGTFIGLVVTCTIISLMIAPTGYFIAPGALFVLMTLIWSVIAYAKMVRSTWGIGGAIFATLNYVLFFPHGLAGLLLMPMMLSREKLPIAGAILIAILYLLPSFVVVWSIIAAGQQPKAPGSGKSAARFLPSARVLIYIGSGLIALILVLILIVFIGGRGDEARRAARQSGGMETEGEQRGRLAKLPAFEVTPPQPGGLPVLSGHLEDDNDPMVQRLRGKELSDENQKLSEVLNDRDRGPQDFIPDELLTEYKKPWTENKQLRYALTPKKDAIELHRLDLRTPTIITGILRAADADKNDQLTQEEYDIAYGVIEQNVRERKERIQAANDAETRNMEVERTRALIPREIRIEMQGVDVFTADGYGIEPAKFPRAISPEAKKWLADADKNGDKIIDQDEIAAAPEMAFNGMGGSRMGGGGNGMMNGALMGNENNALLGKLPFRYRMPIGQANALTPDGQRIELSKLTGVIPSSKLALFTESDANGDGFLDASEVEAIAQKEEERQQHPEQFPHGAPGSDGMPQGMPPGMQPGMQPGMPPDMPQGARELKGQVFGYSIFSANGKTIVTDNSNGKKVTFEGTDISLAKLREAGFTPESIAPLEKKDTDQNGIVTEAENRAH